MEYIHATHEMLYHLGQGSSFCIGKHWKGTLKTQKKDSAVKKSFLTAILGELKTKSEVTSVTASVFPTLSIEHLTAINYELSKPYFT